jgi:predicted Rossmann-fold nucleotide-binding protein
MERLVVIEGLEKNAANGGILVAPGELRSAKRNYIEAVITYREAQKKLIEKALPRHYRVAVWGSARFDENDPEYAFARNLSEALVDKVGCDIVTGAGPGIMEAASEGAMIARKKALDEGRETKSRNLGIRIKVPWEEVVSPALDEHTLHSGFSTRLDEFLTISNAVILAPGGIGSDLELAMALQAKQVSHIEKDYPIIVHPFWLPVIAAMQEIMYDDRVRKGLRPLIGENDLKRLIKAEDIEKNDGLVVTDDIEEIVGIISKTHAKWKVKFHDKIKREEQGKLF